MNINTTIPGFTLRSANEEDCSLILSLIKELAEYEKLSHEVVASESSLKETLFGEHKNTEIIIGEYNNTPVAFALYFYTYSTFIAKRCIYLEDLYVKNEYRGKGFGKHILHYLAKLTVERDCARLEWSVLDWNQDAINFYQSLGAKPLDDWIRYRLCDKSLENLASQF